MRLRVLALCGVLATMVTVTIPSRVWAQPRELPADDDPLFRCNKPTPGSKPGEVVLSFKPELEVKELVAWVIGFTCKEVVLDPRIVSSRKVTIIAPNRLSHADAYRLFLVALQTINYTVVPKGKVLAVVEAQSARKDAIPLTRSIDGSAQLVRYVYQPTFAPAEALQQAFAAIKSDAGDVQLVGTMLLVTDYGSHVKEMLALAKLVDVPKGSEGIYLLPVRHADASKLGEKLTGILGLSGAARPEAAGRPEPRANATPAAAAPAKLLVDERTNTLIVAASAAGYERVKALVERLDVALEIEGGTTFHVYKLQSAIAEDLAKTLNEAIGQRAQAPAAKPGAPAGAPAPEAPTVEGQVRIIGDKPTNSLIVMSSGRDFLAVRALIRELDTPRRQVWIEAMILEVNVATSSELGTSSHGALPGTNGALLLGGVQLPSLKSTDIRTLAGATGLIGGLVGKQLATQSLFGRSIPSYGLLFQALASTGHTRIVSTPSMMGIDNKESKQAVGVDIPYERGQLEGFGVDPTAVRRTFERRKLQHELAITPHISGDDTVLLDIKHAAEDLGEQMAGGPTWNTRAFETSVIVKDRNTIVVGGLVQEREVRSTTKVPLLGDLPILGHLFKYSKREKRRTNLVLMLTPYVIKDQLDLQQIQDRKLRDHHELVESFRALDGMAYKPHVDYSRKRGLVEEINRTVLANEEDAAARAQLREPVRVTPGAVVPEGTPVASPDRL